MTRWEYRLELVHTDHDHDPEASVRALDRLGTDGWEAVGIAPATAARHGLGVESSAFVVLLKRSRRSTR
ncbi:MAG: hypothetical protein U0V73_16125 [Acidimicrobiia bacterium]